MRAEHFVAILASAVVGCQPAAEFPGGFSVTQESTVSTPEPGVGFNATLDPEPVDVAMCNDDLGCMMDEACGVFGGCDADPCTDDRCMSGRCVLGDVPGCDPGYVLEYSYSACCPTRTLAMAPDGRLTFTIEGADPVVYDYVAPAYLASLVNRAGAVGFFGWDHGRCVPGESASDFSLSMSDGVHVNTISCEAGVCVGQLCDVLDNVWAVMPSNWQDGCTCEG